MKKLLIVCVVVFLGLSACTGIVVAAAGGSGGDRTVAKATTAPRAGANSGMVAAADEAEAPFPTPDDYDVSIKILSKQCFGSAGCNIEARLTLTGLSDAAMNTAAEVTIKVTGSSDGAQIETVELDDEGQYSAPELYLSTNSKASKLKAKVTEVEAP